MAKKINISGFTEEQEIKPPDSSPLAQSYSDIWGSSCEKIESIDLNLIRHYRDGRGNSQPFRLDGNKVNQIMASASDIGIITPLIVRRMPENNYQIIAGHHRYEAARQLNLLSVPCVVKNVTDDEVFQIVAESNIQRDKVLPSEYGKIFSAYMEKRNDNDMTAAEIAQKFGVSKKTMYRYINVSVMLPELQHFVDDEKILLAAAEIISGFSESNQRTVQQYLERPDSRKITPVTAKKFAEMIDNYNGDDVPVQELSNLFFPKPKPKYKNDIYNNISSRFKIDMSEKELNELSKKLLTEYFEKRKGGDELC